jgi:hypothetical protein
LILGFIAAGLPAKAESGALGLAVNGPAFGSGKLLAGSERSARVAQVELPRIRLLGVAEWLAPAPAPNQTKSDLKPAKTSPFGPIA